MPLKGENIPNCVASKPSQSTGCSDSRMIHHDWLINQIESTAC